MKGWIAWRRQLLQLLQVQLPKCALSLGTMILFVENTYPCHYEVIESVILDYKKFINVCDIPDIYLSVKDNESFTEYIKGKYPQIKFCKPALHDYYISITVYDKNYDDLIQNSSEHFYISHEVTERLAALSNVIFLTPLARRYINCNMLPFSDIKINSAVPIYIIQGNIHKRRRYYKLLVNILDGCSEPFKIKVVGKGAKLPAELQPYADRIIFRNNLNFADFHREFLDAYCLLPLVTKATHPHYYVNKLTSSINYCRGYKLKCLIDADLQAIYNLEDVEVFTDEHDIVAAFRRTLVHFNVA